jgi:predicted TIM-barrel fold metal-dependent hydrolase
MYAQPNLMPWVNALREDVPDLRLYDAHVHVGLRDPAGLQATEEEALDALEQVDSRALIFPLKEPAGYESANRHLLEVAEAHRGRLRALARVDPADDALGEAERCLAAGAVGIKLHPRGEGFDIADERLDDLFVLADERRLPVMIHAGVGKPEVGPETVERARAHPGARLILAHCAIGAFEQIIHDVDDVPNVFFDTSWWNPADVWALLRMVSPSRILYASDIPFSSPASALVLTGRLAIEAGLSHEQIRGVMGGQLERLVAHADPLELGPVSDEVAPLAPELERLYVTLLTAVEPMLRGEDPGQGLELAQVAAQAPSGLHAEVIECVAALLELNERQEQPDPLRASRTPGFDLVLTAAVAARTPRATSPSPEEIRQLAEAG